MAQPAPYPSDLEDHITLPNDRVLHIRPLRRCEEGPVRELFSHLSPRTRYLRFLSPMPVLPDSVLSLIACVDYRRRLALLAELDTADGAEVVALGGFGAIDDGSAEVSLVVRDEWQQQGIGVAVAARVLQAAESRGFNRFVFHALWDNVGIRKLVGHVGHIVSSNTLRGVSEVSFVRRHAG
ncbi:MAG TPA: GNAT family N-acetyltransferase [Vicinamibacterales bacterium]|jgi:GNAT superfamily N-acetyltransferase|nr:GNAT family N-acetyltransferase [Vicinamibacterales bacterium]